MSCNICLCPILVSSEFLKFQPDQQHPRTKIVCPPDHQAYFSSAVLLDRRVGAVRAQKINHLGMGRFGFTEWEILPKGSISGFLVQEEVDCDVTEACVRPP